jgi:hypothetical protein
MSNNYTFNNTYVFLKVRAPLITLDSWNDPCLLLILIIIKISKLADPDTF